MKTHSEYRPSTYKNRFGSRTDALAEAFEAALKEVFETESRIANRENRWGRRR